MWFGSTGLCICAWHDECVQHAWCLSDAEMEERHGGRQSYSQTVGEVLGMSGNICFKILGVAMMRRLEREQRGVSDGTVMGVFARR